jgi:hypothetical protein
MRPFIWQRIETKDVIVENLHELIQGAFEIRIADRVGFVGDRRMQEVRGRE